MSNFEDIDLDLDFDVVETTENIDLFAEKETVALPKVRKPIKVPPMKIAKGTAEVHSVETKQRGSVASNPDIKKDNKAIIERKGTVSKKVEVNPIVEKETKGLSPFGVVLVKTGRHLKQVITKKGSRKKQEEVEKQEVVKEVQIPVIYVILVIAVLMGIFALVSGVYINKYDTSRRATVFNLEYDQTYQITRIKIGEDITVKFKEYSTESVVTPTVVFNYKHKSVDDAYYRLFKYYLKEGDYVVYTDTKELSRLRNPVEDELSDDTDVIEQAEDDSAENIRVRSEEDGLETDE